MNSKELIELITDIVHAQANRQPMGQGFNLDSRAACKMVATEIVSKLKDTKELQA